MRDLTWLSGVQGSSRAAAHARFVMAHRAGRELRERAPGTFPRTVQMDEELRQTLALLFPQEFAGTTAR
jgi:hypothetical protein